MHRTHVVLFVAIGFFMYCLSAMAQGVSLDKFPPSVIKTVPECGASNIDPDLNEISVTFSKNMLDNSWSFVEISKEFFPKLVGKPKYLDDKRTCVVQVELKPDTTYAVWLNSSKFVNFKDTLKQPAVPYLLVFKTGPSGQAK